jgi:hypothetical protein
MDTHFDPDNPYHIGVHDSPQRTNRTNKEEQAINTQTKRSTPFQSNSIQLQWNWSYTHTAWASLNNTEVKHINVFRKLFGASRCILSNGRQTGLSIIVADVQDASSRFDDFDDDQKDPDPSPKPSPQATPRRKSSSNAMAKGRLASAQKAKDIMESMKKGIRSDESYFEETRVVDDNIRIVSQTPPDTPGSDRPRSAGRHAKSRSRNNSFSGSSEKLHMMSWLILR